MEIAIVVVLAVAALAALAAPFLRPERTAAALPIPTDIDAEVRRYRAALHAGTVCRACAEANPAGSRFCGRCGRALATRSASENA